MKRSETSKGDKAIIWNIERRYFKEHLTRLLNSTLRVPALIGVRNNPPSMTNFIHNKKKIKIRNKHPFYNEYDDSH